MSRFDEFVDYLYYLDTKTEEALAEKGVINAANDPVDTSPGKLYALAGFFSTLSSPLLYTAFMSFLAFNEFFAHHYKLRGYSMRDMTPLDRFLPAGFYGAVRFPLMIGGGFLLVTGGITMIVGTLNRNESLVWEGYDFFLTGTGLATLSLSIFERTCNYRRPTDKK